MKIVKLTAENVKRLTAVEVTPEGNLVIVGGPNSAGKSSVLDSIMYALAGAGSIPSQPIRIGAKSAKVVLELDGERTLVVERTMSSRGATLIVRPGPKGPPLSGPQALLDSFCGKIAFDPLEFTRLKPRDQMERLRDLVGLDFTEHDAQRKALFDERTVVNRDAKALKAQFDAAPQDPDAPDEEVSIAQLMGELQRRQQTNAANDTARRSLSEQEHEVERLQFDVEARKSRIAELDRRLEADREDLRKATRQVESLASQLAIGQKAVDALKDEDTTEVERQIADSDRLNARVRAQQERQRLVEQLVVLSGKADRLTNELADLDVAKMTAMEAANWPVPGLGFDADGVTYNDLPFNQAGSAEALKVSVAISAALNPILRVILIRDGSLLDDENRASIADIAKERDLQLWIEQVGEGKECSVVIKDGHVRNHEEEN